MKKLILLLNLILGNFIYCQWSSDSSVNTPVCTFSGNQQSNLTVPADLNGAYIVWNDTRNGNDDIYAQKLNSNGYTQWQTNGIPVCNSAGHQNNIKAVSDDFGNLFVAWYDYRDNSRRIYIQKITKEGIIAWSNNGINLVDSLYGTLYQSFSLCHDGNSGAIIFWTDTRFTSSDYDLFTQRINSQGIIVWQNGGVQITSSNNSQKNSKCLNDGFGGAVVVYEDSRNAASGNLTDIYTQRIDSNANIIWQSNGIPVCVQPRDQADPQIFKIGPGEFAFGWRDERQPGPDTWDIYAQKINLSGSLLWTINGVVVCNAQYGQGGVQLAEDNNGGVILVWGDNRNEISGSQPMVYTQRINNSGTPVWQNNGILICSYISNPSGICSDDSSGAIITWHDARYSNGADLFAQSVDADGAFKWRINGINVSSAMNDQVNASIIKGGNGSVVFSWQDSRISYSDLNIYAQKVLSDGTLSNVPTIKVNFVLISEGVFFNPRLSRKDSVIVRIRNSVSPYEIRDSVKTNLDSLTYSSLVTFGNVPTGSYYLVARPFSSLETWSKSGGESLTANGPVNNYNFTTSLSQAYGNNQKIKSGKACIYSGDVNKDGVIDGTDLSIIDNDANEFTFGRFEISDLNGDNYVEGSDLSIADNNVSQFIGVISP